MMAVFVHSQPPVSPSSRISCRSSGYTSQNTSNAEVSNKKRAYPSVATNQATRLRSAIPAPSRIEIRPVTRLLTVSSGSGTNQLRTNSSTEPTTGTAPSAQ